ncbi:hypothetical protein KUTeg_002424 [Tegillarca granosa]|uniref:ATP-grasp domain-containing protein n=1 Tax=Tegillarca granosa TaxID=220873 RepID=A0ABQ9FVL1_TEGGR|nr:hypothetical protein KUTeg_002424 [Tegillarca granosa]
MNTEILESKSTEIAAAEAMDKEILELLDSKSTEEGKWSILQSQKADEYTTATGSYCYWSQDVDLGPPDKTTPIPEEDEHILDYYNALQYSLYENDLPETVDRTHKPQTQYTKNNIAITILSSPVECMSFLLEGSRTCPGDMLLVMSMTWLQFGEAQSGSNARPLFVRKAILFDRAGKSYIDIFDPPRRVTYFMNFFTRACTNGQRNDGEDIEAYVDCPMSSSLNLVKMVDDKIWTRILMAESGVFYPETLAFAYKSKKNYTIPQNASIKVVRLDTKTGVDNLALDEIQKFVERDDVKDRNKIVVKPSGTIWHGSLGVTFHHPTNIIGIWNAVLELLNDIEEENGILVETFYSYQPSSDNKQNKMSFRMRSYVCRGTDDKAVSTTIVCGIGEKNKPIHGDNTVPQSLQSTLRQFGFSTSECDCIQNEVFTSSEKLLNNIIEKEKNMSVNERGSPGAQTDLIANSHDCTISAHLYEFINPELSGKSVRPLVDTMVNRSQKFLLRGRHILVIGAGGYSKRFIWKDAKAYDVKILKRRYSHLDGCVTFWEDCGPLAAIICTKLRLNGAGEAGARNAKNKTLTQKLLLSREAEIPHFPKAYLYAAKTFHINSELDVKVAVDEIGLPAVLKLEHGSSAVGVKLVNDIDECHSEYEKIQHKLQDEADHPGIGLGYGNSMQLMEFIDGTEHDIDIIIYKRKLIGAFVSDNGPTRSDSFTETAASMPTCLPSDKRAQLVTSAYTCCNELGLINGVFNVEMKMTQTGPKLLEINARMGGFYLRDWIKACYGVDLLFCAFLISCGIKPILPRVIAPKMHLMGVMCIPSKHSGTLTDPLILHQLAELRNQNEVRYNQIEASLDQEDDDLEEPYCNIAVMEPSLEKAKQKLISVCQKLNIDKPDYPIKHFLVDFKEQT